MQGGVANDIREMTLCAHCRVEMLNCRERRAEEVGRAEVSRKHAKACQGKKKKACQGKKIKGEEQKSEGSK